MSDSPSQGNQSSRNSSSGNRPGGRSGGRRRRRSGGGNRERSGGAPRDAQARPQTGEQSSGPRSAEGRNKSFQSRSRRRSGGRTLTTNQVLIKYDNLLEQHLITRRKYFEYFNRADDRQLRRLEKNFYDSIEHLRRFENNLEPWQREALEKRKTERYQLDLTYSNNRGWDPEEIAKAEFAPDENEDPHFKDSQKEAFEEYKEDTEESEGSYEDYLRVKGLA